MFRKKLTILLLASLVCLFGNNLITAFGYAYKASAVYQDQPLADSAQKCAIADVKALLAKGVDADSRGLLRRTPLMLAAGAVCTEVLQLLLEKGVDVNAKDNDGRTALIYLIYVGMRTGLDTVVAKAQDAARDLVNKGADINAKDNGGITVLMYAVQRRDSAIVSMLLEKGAEVNAKRSDGQTALMDTVGGGGAQIARMLIDKGAKINDTNEKGQTALILAAEAAYNEDVVSVLLAKGADVSAKDKERNTALKIATRNGNSKIVAMLKKAGAKV